MPQDLSAIRWPIATPRLRIRPATEDDVDATYAIRSRADVSAWITAEATDRGAYREQFLDPDRLAKTLVIERADAPGVVLGDLMLAVRDGWAQAEVRADAAGTEAELGWVVDPDHAGRGLATEAVGALVRACFVELGIRRVVADCFADNTASWRLMERLGMRRETVAVRDALHRSGRWLDSYAYALLADEWRDDPGAPGRP